MNSFAFITGETVTVTGPGIVTGLMNSGGDVPGSMIVAVSTVCGGGRGQCWRRRRSGSWRCGWSRRRRRGGSHSWCRCSGWSWCGCGSWSAGVYNYDTALSSGSFLRKVVDSQKMFVGNDDCQSRARFRDDHALEVTGKRDCNAKAANQECRRVPAHFYFCDADRMFVRVAAIPSLSCK